MKLLDIRDNLAKISYYSEEQLAIGRFLILKDIHINYIAQIVNLKADVDVNYAIAKLIFTFNSDGVVDSFDGSIPSLTSELSHINSKDILSLLPIESPVLFGKLAQQEENLVIDESVLEKNFLICAEKFDNIYTIVTNLAKQIELKKEKFTVIDTDFSFTEMNQFRFKKDFKMPFNIAMLNFILKNDFDGIDADSRATLNDIIYQIQEYIMTLKDGFIPFSKFLDVISAQYEQTYVAELAILKNRLLKYKEENIFAESADEFKCLKEYILNHDSVYIDISNVPENLQKELIHYILKTMDSTDEYIYNFVKLTSNNSDKDLLRELLGNKHIFSTIICSHNYKYVYELKQKAENVVLFAPQTVQHDFAAYNTFLSKLNVNEFVVYGQLTQNIPFIVELSELSLQDLLGASNNNRNTENDENTFDDTLVQNDAFENEFDFSQQQVPQNNFENDFEETHTIQPIENVFDESNEFENDAENDLEKFDDDSQIVENDVQELSDDNQTMDNVFDSQPEELNFEEQPEIVNNTIEEDFETDEVENTTSSIEDDFEVQENIEENFENNYDDNIEISEPDESLNPSDNMELDSVELDFNNEDSFEQTESQIEENDLPVFKADTATTDVEFAQGDKVSHAKYGNGVIEKIINYGNKTLCSIEFENVGRRLLDPSISSLTKLS